MLEILTGNRLQLEPLSDSHQDELYEIAQNELIWTHNSSKAFGDEFYRWFDKAMKCLETEQQLPFAVRRLSDQKLVGSTRYYEIDSDHNRLSIGYTWYVPEVWGSYVNFESKYLLLKQAFEELQTNRVQFVTDARNVRSRAAIKKIGAIEEGTLRSHMILQDGTIRDSVIFSMTQPDWPVIKSNLETRLNNFK